MRIAPPIAELFRPLERKLPLLIAALLCVVIATFGWLVNHELKSALETVAGDRLGVAAQRLASPMSQSAGALRLELGKVAADSTVIAALIRPGAATRNAATATLGRSRPGATQPASQALWTTRCEMVAAAGPLRDSPSLRTCPVAAATNGRRESGTLRDWVQPLVAHGDSISYAIVAPVVAGAADTIGYLVQVRSVSGQQSGALISGLIGKDVLLLIGNASGPSLWTDFSKRTDGPPLRGPRGVPEYYTPANGTPQLGVALNIAATPWVVWVQMPVATILAGENQTLSKLTIIALLCLAIGVLGAWGLSRHVTRPLVELTRAAEDLALGNYSRRVATVRQDEFGQLMSSFNRMASEVEAANHTLQEQAQELEVSNLELSEAAEENRRRQLAEQIATDASLRLQTVLDSATETSIIATDVQGLITVFNRGAERMLGYAAAEVVGKQTPLFIHDVAEVEARGRELSRQLGRVVQGFDVFIEHSRHPTGEVVTNDWTYLRKDGTRLTVGLTVLPIADAAGHRTGFLGVATDVTEQRHTEQALEQQRLQLRAGEERYRAMAEGLGEGLVLTDLEDQVLDVNPRLLELTGFSREELIGQTALEMLLPPEMHGLFKERNWERADGKPERYTTEILRRDGSRFWTVVTASPLRDAAGQTIGTIGAVTDMTERMQAEAELDRFFALSLDMLCIANADGYFKRVSPAFTEALGWSVSEMLARPFLDCVHPDDHAATIREVERQVVAGENVLQFENRYQHKDGSYRVLSWRSVPQPGGMMYAVARDVTEKREAELTLGRALDESRRANAELDEASRFKDEFLANMSHELRTPLNAILGLSETLLEQLADTVTPRQVMSLTTISTSGQHLLALINDILDLSKIEAGMLELNLDTVDLQGFCESCLTFVRTQATQKHIAVACEYDGRVATLSADPKRLKQILVNLLTNAVKFTPEGGRIGLTVAAPEGEDVVRFAVWDTGIGIAPAAAAKLFRAFTQLDSGLSRDQEGTGLGLALVAKLAELHGGGVALESEPGKGSRFIVTLPQIAAHAPALELAPLDETDRRGDRRALIVEDDPTSGAMLVKYLTELGLSTVVHPRGEEAVEAVLRERPDVILLDIQLPGDSGWMVLMKLKEHHATRDIPVVVISVVDEPQKSRALGAVAHFTKPVTRAQLAEFFQRPAVEPPRRAARLTPAPSATGPLVLLAEDNEANVQTIGGYLEDKGYAMLYALNGLVAVKLARERRPALILMDIQMPVMDGLTAIREIRADATMQDIPIVALTALAMAGDRERCLAAGATEYLSKPVSLKGLAALVSRLVSQTGVAVIR